MPGPLRCRRRPARGGVATSWRRPPARGPLILGHRGARQRAPENTLAAFDLALDEGAAGVELDVRLDGSQEVVVLHDRTLRRVTRELDPRDVETLTSAELATIDVGGNQRVPRLSEVLAWAARRGARVNIELKHDVSHPARLVARVAALLRREPDAGYRCLLSSFHPGIVHQLARLIPAVPTALLVSSPPQMAPPAAAWHALGARGLHPLATLVTPELIAAVGARGGVVNAWTVNDVERARSLAELGIDGLVTDDPLEIAGALDY
ncbi:MAG: glycerophosphodiester phosphodiesterase [Polyangiaceae bacterium]|nr:glycerophosphodiester phosphodiesterase [Polyangiaceae bacterium]